MEQGSAFLEEREERVAEDESVCGVLVFVMRKGTSSTMMRVRVRVQGAAWFGYQWKKKKKLRFAHSRYVHRLFIDVGEVARRERTTCHLLLSSERTYNWASGPMS